MEVWIAIGVGALFLVVYGAAEHRREKHVEHGKVEAARSTVRSEARIGRISVMSDGPITRFGMHSAPSSIESEESETVEVRG